MKLRYWLLTLVIATVACAATAFVSNTQWSWHGKPILELREDGESLQFGLRNDGVVIWRTVTATTNSPGERTGVWWYYNDVFVTNYWINTNIIIDTH